jgi:hypothetical protein
VTANKYFTNRDNKYFTNVLLLTQRYLPLIRIAAILSPGVCRPIHAMHNANKPHHNEAGRSRTPVAVYLMKLQEHRFEKKSLKIIHLKKSTKLQKTNLKGKS